VREALVAEAVDYFEATIAVGAADAAVAQAARYAGDRVWAQLTDNWSGRNCRGLARLARAALDGKDWLHNRIGDFVGFLLECLVWSEFSAGRSPSGYRCPGISSL
jgi:hypothetical protein